MIIGIDSSYTSPGITIKTNKYNFYGFSNKKKHNGLNYENRDFKIEIFYLPKHSNRLERYNYFIDVVFNLIEKINEDVEKVYIEEYSYDSWSQGLSKIHEFSGILQYNFYIKNQLTPIEIPPKKIKKYFSETGNATKYHMVQVFCNHFNFDFYNLFQFNQNQNKLEPLSDIADSFAVLSTGIKEKIKKLDIVDNILDNM